jgi:hypothetical protein
MNECKPQWRMLFWHHATLSSAASKRRARLPSDEAPVEITFDSKMENVISVQSVLAPERSATPSVKRQSCQHPGSAAPKRLHRLAPDEDTRMRVSFIIHEDENGPR